MYTLTCTVYRIVAAARATSGEYIVDLQVLQELLVRASQKSFNIDRNVCAAVVFRHRIMTYTLIACDSFLM